MRSTRAYLFSSWLYLLSAEDESNPEKVVKEAGLVFANIPLPCPDGLTDEAAGLIINCLQDLPKPTMVMGCCAVEAMSY